MVCTPIEHRNDTRNDPNFAVKPLAALLVPLEFGSYLTSFFIFNRSTDHGKVTSICYFHQYRSQAFGFLVSSPADSKHDLSFVWSVVLSYAARVFSRNYGYCPMWEFTWVLGILGLWTIECTGGGTGSTGPTKNVHRGVAPLPVSFFLSCFWLSVWKLERKGHHPPTIVSFLHHCNVGIVFVDEKCGK